MKSTTRSNTTRWAAAAAAGLTLMGCPDKKDPTASENDAQKVATPAGSKKDCCMGLNECKGKGGCAVPESNACAGKNECKGKGGCNMHCPK